MTLRSGGSWLLEIFLLPLPLTSSLFSPSLLYFLFIVALLPSFPFSYRLFPSFHPHFLFLPSSSFYSFISFLLSSLSPFPSFFFLTSSLLSFLSRCGICFASNSSFSTFVHRAWLFLQKIFSRVCRVCLLWLLYVFSDSSGDRILHSNLSQHAKDLLYLPSLVSLLV